MEKVDRLSRFRNNILDIYYNVVNHLALDEEDKTTIMHWITLYGTVWQGDKRILEIKGMKESGKSHITRSVYNLLGFNINGKDGKVIVYADGTEKALRINYENGNRLLLSEEPIEDTFRREEYQNFSRLPKDAKLIWNRLGYKKEKDFGRWRKHSFTTVFASKEYFIPPDKGYIDVFGNARDRHWRLNEIWEDAATVVELFPSQTKERLVYEDYDILLDMSIDNILKTGNAYDDYAQKLYAPILPKRK